MQRVALFARAPLGSGVKTRLQPALPGRLALDLYAASLADSLTAVAACPAGERFVYWADAHGPARDSIAPRRQRGDDLGARLSAAFEELLEAPPDHALIVGSDAPALRAAHLAEAFAALEAHDVVLGPALDGGYWCVGLRRAAPEIFRDIPWSTDRVLAVTLERARAAGLRVATAATLQDLDTPADLARLVGALAAHDELACGPSMRAALEALGLALAR